LIVIHIDSPYFICKISFVISTCYLVARAGGGMSGARQYYDMLYDMIYHMI